MEEYTPVAEIVSFNRGEVSQKHQTLPQTQQTYVHTQQDIDESFSHHGQSQNQSQQRKFFKNTIANKRSLD
jgi:hypothetical protein